MEVILQNDFKHNLNLSTLNVAITSLYFYFTPEEFFQFQEKGKCNSPFPLLLPPPQLLFSSIASLSIFSCYSPVPSFPTWSSFTIQFSHTILLAPGFCVPQYVSYPYPYRWREHSAPSVLSKIIKHAQGNPGKLLNSGLQFQIAPNPLKQLRQSQLFSSRLQHVKILSSYLGDLISICSTDKMGQCVCLLNLMVPTFLQQVHIAFPVATLKGSLTSLWESLCASSVFMIVNSA